MPRKQKKPPKTRITKKTGLTEVATSITIPPVSIAPPPTPPTVAPAPNATPVPPASTSNTVPAAVRRQFVVLYYPSGESIGINDVVTLTNELKNNIKDPVGLRLDLIIHSWGGDIYSAFKMIKTIRNYCSELYALVPIRAVSAASLMTLGADKIYMSSQSQLGPLDLPTEHPTIEGTKVSSIDCVKALPYIEGIMKSVALNRYAELQHWTSLGKKDAITLAYNVAAKFVEPLINKIDPIQTSKSSRDLEIAQIYGLELLNTYMAKNKTVLSKSTDDIISSLVYDYPAHGFAICYTEAKKIGLNVFPETDYPEWPKVWTFINRLSKFTSKRIWHLTEGQFDTWTSVK